VVYYCYGRAQLTHTKRVTVGTRLVAVDSVPEVVSQFPPSPTVPEPRI